MLGSLTLGPNPLRSGCFCRPCLSNQVASRAEQAWLSCHHTVYPARAEHAAGDQDGQRLVQRSTRSEKGKAPVSPSLWCLPASNHWLLAEPETSQGLNNPRCGTSATSSTMTPGSMPDSGLGYRQSAKAATLGP